VETISVSTPSRTRCEKMMTKKLEYQYTGTDWETFKDLEKMLPEGCRWAEHWEVDRDRFVDKELNKRLKDDLLIVNTPKGLRAAGLYYSDDEFLIIGYGILNRARSRGVYVKKGGIK